MSLRRPTILTIAVLLVSLAALPAMGWEWTNECRNPVTWNTTNINMAPSNPDFPVGSQQLAALNQMRNAWNLEAPGSRVRFNYNFAVDDNVALNNGVNSIVIATGGQWNTIVPLQFRNALAVTFTRLSRNNCPWLFGSQPRIREADILFNPGRVWDFAVNPPPPHPQGPFNFAIVGIHELGHAFGLAHENDVMGTMDEFYEDGGVIGNFNEIQPHADDVAGARDGYGSAGTFRDLAASAFRRTAGGISDPIPAPATAARNQRITFPFTFENRGTTNQASVRVQFFLSTNRFITTGDTLLGTSTFSINAGVLSTLNASVTIPGNMAPGNYHLGWIVDPQNAIGEADEGNNAVGLVDQTTVTANAFPNACCDINPQWGNAPLQVTADASCSNDPGGGPLTYTWDLDDGTIRTGQTVNHWYSDSGSYFVTLTVREPGGLTDTAFCFVDVFCEDEIFGDCLQ
ncbi:MAG: PKD domain-containing protein [Acidobacteriota bacterium]